MLNAHMPVKRERTGGNLYYGAFPSRRYAPVHSKCLVARSALASPLFRGSPSPPSLRPPRRRPAPARMGIISSEPGRGGGAGASCAGSGWGGRPASSVRGRRHAPVLTAPSGMMSSARYFQRTTASLRATATMATFRIRRAETPCAVRPSNHLEMALPGWCRSQSHAACILFAATRLPF